MTKEIVVCALGKTGDGKSSLLNNILQKEVLRTSAEDGRMTTTVVVEKGLWLNDNDCKATVIDTPGFADKNEGNLGQQILYDNLLTFVEACSRGVNAFLVVFNVKKIEFDENFLSTLDLFRIMFGQDFFQNICLVFTYCDDDNKNLEESVTNGFVKEFHSKLNFTHKIPVFFTSNKSHKGLKELAAFAENLPRFDCAVMKHLRELQADSTKTKLDQDRYIEETLKSSLVKTFGCNIL
jgi:GTPase Era involved in 16S rRNA processing